MICTHKVILEPCEKTLFIGTEKRKYILSKISKNVFNKRAEPVQCHCISFQQIDSYFQPNHFPCLPFASLVQMNHSLVISPCCGQEFSALIRNMLDAWLYCDVANIVCLYVPQQIHMQSLATRQDHSKCPMCHATVSEAPSVISFTHPHEPILVLCATRSKQDTLVSQIRMLWNPEQRIESRVTNPWEIQSGYKSIYFQNMSWRGALDVTRRSVDCGM